VKSCEDCIHYEVCERRLNVERELNRFLNSVHAGSMLACDECDDYKEFCSILYRYTYCSYWERREVE